MQCHIFFIGVSSDGFADAVRHLKFWNFFGGALCNCRSVAGNLKRFGRLSVVSDEGESNWRYCARFVVARRRYLSYGWIIQSRHQSKDEERSWVLIYVWLKVRSLAL